VFAVPPRSSATGGFTAGTGNVKGTPLGSGSAAPRTRSLTKKRPSSPALAERSCSVAPQIGSLVVVAQSDTFTGAPPVTKFDEGGPPQVVPAEKTALTAASLGVARASAAIASAASQPPMYLLFVKSDFPSCPARR